MTDSEQPDEAANNDRFNAPKMSPDAFDPIALELVEPPVTKLHRGIVIGGVVGVAVLGIGAMVFASKAPSRVNAAQGSPVHYDARASAKPPAGLQQFKFASTPASPALTSTVPPDAPQSAVDALPVTHSAPPISTVYRDQDEMIREAAGYEPPPRYAALTSRKPKGEDDVDHASDEADLPSRMTLAPKNSSHGASGADNSPSVPLLPQQLLTPPGIAGGAQLGQLGQMLAAAGDGDDVKKEQFMSRAGIPTNEMAETDLGECDISAGRGVTGNLLVATNSDVPSGNTVTFTVTRTVYCGADRQDIALPQGSTFTGEVNHGAVYGQTRQQLCMKQLERPASASHPTGSRLDIGCAVVADIQGAPGIEADVDNHWPAIIAGSLLNAVLSIGASASMGEQQGFAATTAQNAAHSAGANVNQAGQRIVTRELQRKPTLTTPILRGVRVMFASNIAGLDPWKPRTHSHRHTF